MNLAAPAPYIELPKLVTDAGYLFDYAFFDGDLDTPHDFASGDVFSLVLVPNSVARDKIAFLSSDIGSPLSLTAPNAVGIRAIADQVADFDAGTYAVELRRIGTDGATDLLAIGKIKIALGLSLGGTLVADNDFGYPRSPSVSGANIIYQNASAQIVYPAYAPMSSLGLLLPHVAPPTPSAGALIYCDAADGAVKIKYSNGLVVGLSVITGQVTHDTMTGDFTLDGTAGFWPVDASGGPINITVPPGSDFEDVTWDVVRLDASGNDITFIMSGPDLLNGEATQKLRLQWDEFSIHNLKGSSSWVIK